MRAVVFNEPGETMTVEEVERPEAGPDEVVVETEACGVCRSDWHAWRGDWSWIGLVPTPGLIFGHEPVGRIVEVGEAVEEFSIGDLVTNPFNLSDGTCRHCRAGRATICESSVPMGFVPFQNGAFAEAYAVRHADQNLVPIPETLDPAAVAGLGCRFSTAFHGLVDRVHVRPGEWVSIHGCGGVGLSAVHIADALGANVIAVDIDANSLEKARELGADRTVRADEVADVPQAVKKHTDGSRGVDVAVDALGVAETCQDAVGSLDAGGRHLQIGLTTAEEGGDVSLPVDTMVTNEIEFYGAYGMSPHEYGPMIDMMETGRLSPGSIVTETIALADVPETVASMGEYETVGIPVVTEFE